jgi:hypothetical protein
LHHVRGLGFGPDLTKDSHMGKSVHSAKDIVRERSEDRCEKCGGNLTQRRGGNPEAITDRSIHHRQPRRHGGRDSAINMVHICVGCHRAIHEDEENAGREGWIIIDRFPGKVPFLGWRGWVLPRLDGGLDLVDWDAGRTSSLLPALAPSTRRYRVASRSRPGHRKSRKSARAA